MNSNSAF